MQVDGFAQHFASGCVTSVQQKRNHRGDTDVGRYNSDDFVQPEQMCQKQGYQHLVSPCRNDAHEYSECDGCRDSQVGFRRMDDMFGEKTLAVLPGQFAEKVAGDNPQESDKYQYRIQDADTGEIPERAEMRNPLFLWRIIDSTLKKA